MPNTARTARAAHDRCAGDSRSRPAGAGRDCEYRCVRGDVVAGAGPRTRDRRPCPVEPGRSDGWNRNLATTTARAGLGSRVVSQALCGEKVRVLAVRGRWAKVVVPDQPTPLDRRGYPGWLPLRPLASAGNGAGGEPGGLQADRSPSPRGRTLRLSYGTRLPVAGRDARGSRLVRTPDGPGRLARDALRRAPAHRRLDRRLGARREARSGQATDVVRATCRL